MNKQIIIGIAIILLVMPIVPALELNMYNEKGAEESIFAPGETAVFRLKTSDDVDTVTIIVMQETAPILTDRMKIFSLTPKEFAYAYEIKEDAGQGDYAVKIIAKGDSTETMSEDLYVGEKIHLSFVEPEEQTEEEIGFFQKLWRFIKGIFVKNE
jgi:hypothetical protein